MKITKVTVTPVNIPLETPMFWTGGHDPGTSKAIIEEETDEGLTGLGVAPSAVWKLLFGTCVGRRGASRYTNCLAEQ